MSQSSEATVWVQDDMSEHYIIINQILSDIHSAISCAVACLKVLGADCISYAYAEAALTCIIIITVVRYVIRDRHANECADIYDGQMLHVKSGDVCPQVVIINLGNQTSYLHYFLYF